MPAMRVCPCTGCPAHRRSCPELTRGGRCPDCAQQHEQLRGTRQQRGYGRQHDRLRKQWANKVELGNVACARCHLPILLGQRWALDHTDDRTGYLGPSHATCNNSAGGKAAHFR